MSEAHESELRELPRRQRQWHLLGAKRIELREVDVRRPDAGEALLRIDAALTCGTDLKVFRAGGHARMLHPPCPFGHEMAGTVVDLGEPVDESLDLKVGDRVVVANSASCGVCPPCSAGRENLCLDLHYLNGAFGQYLTIPARFVARSLHKIPQHLDARHAALAEPLACVLHMMELVELDLALWRSDTSTPLRAAVFGAGPLGVLITHQLTAHGIEVDVADPNSHRADAAKSFGAARTITLERNPGRDPELHAPPELREQRHHLAIDASGTIEGWQAAVGAARPGGTAVFFGGVSAGVLALRAHPLHYDELTLRGVYHHRPETFARAVEVIASGALPCDLLLGPARPLVELPEALDAMLHRNVLKVHLRP